MRAPGQPAPVEGIERAGYRLVWRDTPNAYDKARMAASKGYDLTHSLGLTIDKDGVAGSILWNGPAFRPDIVNGTRSDERRDWRECVMYFRSRRLSSR